LVAMEFDEELNRAFYLGETTLPRPKRFQWLRRLLAGCDADYNPDDWNKGNKNKSNKGVDNGI